MTTGTGISGTVSGTGMSGVGECTATNTKRGVVEWFNCEHGFGFIVPEDGGSSVFVHFSEIAGNGIYHTLHDGEVVTYEHDRSSHPPQARNVRIAHTDGAGTGCHPNRVRPFRLPR